MTVVYKNKESAVCSPEAFLDLARLAPKVQDGHDVDVRFRNMIVNGEGEPLDKFSIEFKCDFMDAKLRLKLRNIGGNAFNEVITNPAFCRS